ncbi:MAG: DUF1922 domain-containing protein [Promethearchaeota archaeon]
MEEVGWKRDETPYIIFPCKKCKQYMYVKDGQKAKKCLRCGRNHNISDILDTGEIVYGMTAAVDSVKTKQNELATEGLGNIPELRSFGNFKIHNSKKNSLMDLEDTSTENEYEGQFNKMLVEMEEIYKKAPYYAFEILAQNYNIPELEFKFLFHKAQKEGSLIKIHGEYKIQLDYS